MLYQETEANTSRIKVREDLRRRRRTKKKGMRGS